MLSFDANINISSETDEGKSEKTEIMKVDFNFLCVICYFVSSTYNCNLW